MENTIEVDDIMIGIINRPIPKKIITIPEIIDKI